MDVKMRQRCFCGHSAKLHEGAEYSDEGMCHMPGCTCVEYKADPFDLGPEPGGT